MKANPSESSEEERNGGVYKYMRAGTARTRITAHHRHMFIYIIPLPLNAIPNRPTASRSSLSPHTYSPATSLAICGNVAFTKLPS